MPRGYWSQVDTPPTTNDSSQSAGLPQAAVDALWKGNVIEAIKIVRLERNIGLKESKDHVDAYLRGQPALQQKLQAAQAEAKQTVVRWLIGALAVAAAVAYWLMSGRWVAR